MPAVPPEGPKEKATGVTPSAAPSEDFLYHLYRGSDMLMQNRVGEAKDELERALAFQPQDAKSQDLLAGVYFRLGVYPRAIEIWERLVAAYPRDATLRVNLALALFKTGQADEALTHVHAALKIQPDHERAWGYLGLINWRRGHFEEARDAFLRGGQATMARRMEEAMAHRVDPAPNEEAAAHAEREERAMRSAAEEALAQLDAGRPLPMAVETEADSDRPAGGWRAVEPGEEPFPRPLSPRRPSVAPPPESLEGALDRWAVITPKGVSFAVGPRGQLFARTDDAIYARAEGISAVRGRLRTSAVPRRARGRELDATLGGEARPILRWAGPVEAVVAPPEGRRFEALGLHGDVLYVVERCLFAFDEGLVFESATLPLSGEPVPVTQLHGTGTVVLCVAHTPQVLVVDEGAEVHVDPARLVGWTGRLFPTPASGEAHTPALSLRGDGAVFVG
jgi:uncharacterized protein (AIM24 family)